MNRIVIAVVFAAACAVHADPALEQRVAELERDLAELKQALAPVMAELRAREAAAGQRAKARLRMRKDSEIYSQDELREIESLYQVANKKWKTEEGKESLKKLVGKYKKANRTGCALLYLGQMSTGEEREKYLKQAIDDFSDCFYGDGVQVGAYARYYLAYHYRETEDKSKADKLFQELKEHYPDAIDHKGKLLQEVMDQ